MRVWRISNHADLGGIGGLRAGGRWHHRGQPVVYCAENPAAALLEVLVHLEFGDLAELPDAYQLLEIEVADSISRSVLDPASLQEGWRHQPDSTQSIGSRWLAERQSALFWVPSAIVPHTANVLINPLHPDATLLRIVSSARYPFDERLIKPPD
jgi:RES domain-containing protein